MAEEGGQERTEKATPKRIRDAREKGQVVSSREVPSACVLLGAMGAMFFAGAWMTEKIQEVMRIFWGNSGQLHLSPESMQNVLLNLSADFFLILLPVFFAVLVTGVAANVIQVGFTLSPEVLIPKLSKINPLNGIKRLLSIRSLADVVKALFKIGCLGGLGYAALRDQIGHIPELIQLQLPDILNYIWRISFRICLYTVLAMIFLAVADYVFQKWQFEKDQRMTKQETKEEMKQSEGDPKIKSRIRAIQMEMSRKRMMAAIPGAAVVITNPTHLAVALKYETGEMVAPRVVAKGQGFIALRIREIAAENHVPIVENKPLAQTLYKAVEIGKDIPVELYRAVAEILAFVYRMKGA